MKKRKIVVWGGEENGDGKGGKYLKSVNIFLWKTKKRRKKMKKKLEKENIYL